MTGNPAMMLSVDLSTRQARKVEIPERVLRKYIGGRGLGSYLLHSLVPAKADPLGPENHVIFAAGPLSGTGFFYSSKATVTTKSPLTGIYLYSVSSGLLAQELRKSGLWAVDITGKADSPAYLSILDGKVEFRDGSSIWGMETAAAQKVILGGLSDKKAATVGIGPAGEKLVKYAAVFSSGGLYRCFGRGGAGCVMGSKNLKGFVVAGSGEVELPHPDRFKAAKGLVTNRLKTDLKAWGEWHHRYETAADLRMTNELGIIPTRNWQTGQFEGWHGIDKSTTPMGWPEKARTCAPYCPTPGTREVVVKEGPYKGARSDVEWEAVYAFGSQCGVDKMEAI